MKTYMNTEKEYNIKYSLFLLNFFTIFTEIISN